MVYGLDAISLCWEAVVVDHLAALTKTETALTTSDGHPIDVWELNVAEDAEFLSSWAAHFRQCYCLDSEIDAFRAGTGLSRAEYLIQMIFPDKSAAPGPSIRSGDFAELLVCDYVEHLLGYWVPRGKYAEKASRDESIKGVDILGFKFVTNAPSPRDTLLAFEVKAQLTNTAYAGRLQTAVDDSSKDHLRRATTLNATKQRLRRSGQGDDVLKVQRFQNLSDNPYIYRSGAAALLSDSAYDEDSIQLTSVANHQNSSNLELIVIRGTGLMALAHALYERAANEA
ncbi:hypothetical protein ACWWD9_08650 [Methylovorus sp. SPW-M1]